MPSIRQSPLDVMMKKSREILEDGNAYPHWVFEAPKWWSGESGFAYLKELAIGFDAG